MTETTASVRDRGAATDPKTHGTGRVEARSRTHTQPGKSPRPLNGPNAAAGPLVVSKVNPRYFATGSGEVAVYLTGSHFNNNFHDGMGPGKDASKTPESIDFSAYLGFLKDHGHNFIRLWRWEHFKSQMTDGRFHFDMSPQPWPRTGPGKAKDGEPKFDLGKLDQAYYSRLRDRVVAAGNEGIYVSVMLFEGFGLHLTASPYNVEGHPFYHSNNVNKIGITSIVDYQVLPLDPAIQALQEAHIQKVLDTLHDLPNVLYEVANESSGSKADSVQIPDGTTIKTKIGDSTKWQYWVIGFVKQYEDDMGYDKHPVGMTFQYPVLDQTKANEPLFDGPADWVSPGFDEKMALAKKGEGPPPGRWLVNPPVADGTKVVLTDTDHYSPAMADALWAWKSFLRGHNAILYDFGLIDFANWDKPAAGLPPSDVMEPARHAMGDTRRYAQRMKLLEMAPREDLSPTGYVLANPGTEYLVLQPDEKSADFTVEVAAGTYSVEWHSVTTRETVAADKLIVARVADIEFKAPFAAPGPAVLYLTVNRRGTLAP